MMSTKGFKILTLPVLEQKPDGEERMAGGFCTTRDAVSDEELTALAELKKLHQAAKEVKERLAALPDHAPERPTLELELENLRQAGNLWRQRKDEATAAKHARLGNVTLPLDG